MIPSIIAESEVNSYKKAIAAKCPITALKNRVLVIQLRKEFETEKVEGHGFEVVKEGKLWLPKNALEDKEIGKSSGNEHATVKAIVKSLGHTKEGPIDCVEINDIVFVFPGVFETIITIDGNDYFSYSEYDLLAVVNKVKPARKSTKK